MRPYPAYKDSGVEWLGAVPEGWEVVPLRRVVSLNPSKTEIAELDRLQEVSFIPMEAVGANGELELSRSRPIGEVETGYTYFRDGDMTFAKITPCFENGKRALMRGLLGGVGFGTTELTVLRAIPSRVSQEFLFWLLSSPDFRNSGEAHMYGAGGQKRVPDDFVREFRSPLPPLPEQQAIARFLDKEVAKIDALVAEQRRLIALLAEKRQAVISYAVTKGLNPATPLKPSGIDWLGDIPEGWEVVRIKNVARMESGHTPDKKVEAYWENGSIPWVSLNDTSYLKDHDYISETAYSVTQAGIDNSSARILPPGAVVFSRDATIGRCAITTEPMAVSQHFIAWICGNLISKEYLLLCLRAMQQELERMTFGATLKTIGMPDIRKLAIALPSEKEQADSVAAVRRSVFELDAVSEAATSAISLLQERRAALISAAVTGKIDLRPHFAQSFSEPETA